MDQITELLQTLRNDEDFGEGEEDEEEEEEGDEGVAPPTEPLEVRGRGIRVAQSSQYAGGADELVTEADTMPPGVKELQNKLRLMST